MTSILVYYGSTEGQTAKVVDRIAETLEARGYDADAVAADVDADVALDGYDAVLVGASIHLGKHQESVRAFARHHREALAARPTGFFQVSLSAAIDDEERQAEAAGYIEAFVEETGWRPDRIGSFGGALRYSEYGFLKRQMIKRIAKTATGDTDASKDYEYTDWGEVEQFAADFGAFVDAELDSKRAEPEADG